MLNVVYLYCVVFCFPCDIIRMALVDHEHHVPAKLQYYMKMLYNETSGHRAAVARLHQCYVRARVDFFFHFHSVEVLCECRCWSALLDECKCVVTVCGWSWLKWHGVVWSGVVWCGFMECGMELNSMKNAEYCVLCAVLDCAVLCCVLCWTVLIYDDRSRVSSEQQLKAVLAG